MPLVRNWSTTRSTARAAGALALLAALALPVHGETVNRIVATIDGEPITAFALQQFSDRVVRLRQMPESDPAVMLDALITEKLIQKEVSSQGIVIQQEDITRYIDNIKQRNK